MDCALETALGRSVPCPEEACPLWERGGCALDRASVELRERPDAAALLLALRDRLDLLKG